MNQLADGTEVNVFCEDCSVPVKLIVRTNRQNGSQFLGCRNWPDCTYSKPLPIDIVMKLQGAVALPGFLD